MLPYERVDFTYEAWIQKDMLFACFPSRHDKTISLDELIEQTIYFFVVLGRGALPNVFVFSMPATYVPVPLQLVQDPSLESIVGLHMFMVMNIQY